MRVRMSRCIALESEPPTNPVELETWCAEGYSVRPVQTHIDDTGNVVWINENRTVCVAFDDGDERILYPEEIEWVTPPD